MSSWLAGKGALVGPVRSKVGRCGRDIGRSGRWSRVMLKCDCFVSEGVTEYTEIKLPCLCPSAGVTEYTDVDTLV